jgi:hypothetical protein
MFALLAGGEIHSDGSAGLSSDKSAVRRGSWRAPTASRPTTAHRNGDSDPGTSRALTLQQLPKSNSRRPTNGGGPVVPGRGTNQELTT